LRSGGMALGVFARTRPAKPAEIQAHKDACRVPGCGATKFVQILPWFRLKPQRLNSHNSQVLFERNPGTPPT
jgi:hypothetical protein